LYSSIYNIKGILCKYLISMVEKAFFFATTVVSISIPSIYIRGTYGQSIKLAKKHRTLIWRIFATIEKWTIPFQVIRTKKKFEKNCCCWFFYFFICTHKNTFSTHPITCFYDKNSLSRNIKCDAYFVKKLWIGKPVSF
jgi:hypothetical protein